MVLPKGPACSSKPGGNAEGCLLPSLCPAPSGRTWFAFSSLPPLWCEHNQGSTFRGVKKASVAVVVAWRSPAERFGGLCSEPRLQPFQGSQEAAKIFWLFLEMAKRGKLCAAAVGHRGAAWGVQLWAAHPPTLSPTAVGSGCGHSPHLMGDTWTEPRSPAQDPSTLRRQQWLSESGLVSLIAALLLPVASPSPAAEVLLFLFLFLWKSAEQLVWSLVKHPRVMKRLRAELFLPPDAGGAGGGSQRLMRSLCVTSLEAAPVLFLVIFHLPEAPLTPAGNRAADMARSSPRTSPSFSLCPLGLEAPSWLQNCSHPAANKPSRLTEPAVDPT